MKFPDWMDEGKALDVQLNERKAERVVKQRRVETVLRNAEPTSASAVEILKRVVKGGSK